MFETGLIGHKRAINTAYLASLDKTNFRLNYDDDESHNVGPITLMDSFRNSFILIVLGTFIAFITFLIEFYSKF